MDRFQQEVVAARARRSDAVRGGPARCGQGGSVRKSKADYSKNQPEFEEKIPAATMAPMAAGGRQPAPAGAGGWVACPAVSLLPPSKELDFSAEGDIIACFFEN
jgi:hypothetical protein